MVEARRRRRASSSTSPSTQSTSTMASAARSRAMASRSGERSRPVTRAPARAAGRVALPVPQATSSTSLPGFDGRTLDQVLAHGEDLLGHRRVVARAPHGPVGLLHLVHSVTSWMLSRGLEAQHLPVEGQLGLQGAHDRLRAAEAVLLALEGEVGVGHAAPLERFHHLLGLGRWHHRVLESLQQQHGHADAVGEVDRRALPPRLRLLGIGRDQAVHVAGLELVGVACERLGVGHPVVAGAGGEDLGAEHERGQRGVAARAAAVDGEPLAVHLALIGQVARRRDAVLDVDDAPGAAQEVAVLAAEPGAARRS